MTQYEYKVLPAPLRPEKMRGAKTTQDRYAQTLAAMMNAEARSGWEYVRAEALPAEERAGLTRTKTVYLNLLVFRRVLGSGAGESAAAAQPGAATALPRAPMVLVEPPPPGLAPKLGPAEG